jgi:poly-gamma-glutamate capsule biosynthesis protein CapA/YwtB (metallophosphatase superfamily)
MRPSSQPEASQRNERTSPSCNMGPIDQRGRSLDTVTLFLAGDVMTGRGIDQVLPCSGDPQIHEAFAKSANDYVKLAERANGPIQRPVGFDYVWGDALTELERRRPDARIINLETALTRSTRPEPKGINYKMNPANLEVITAAGIDCCVLANNHVLDWGCPGLLEALCALEQAKLHYAGAGRDSASAAAPAILEVPAKARVLVFAFACPSAGVPHHWAAAPDASGINVVRELSRQGAERITEKIRSVTRPQDVVLASIHWGGNWGYEIPREQSAFSHWLVESSNVDIVHGHSSHHVKGIEVHRGKLILYGCGDFIDDYEGITGYEEFRDDLVLMYFPTIRIVDGMLVSLEMVPFQIRNMRLNRASRVDAEWLANTLNREGKPLGTRVGLGTDDVLRLEWQ